MGKSTKHYFKTGKEYTGNVHKMDNGTIHTGKNHTKNSKVVVHFKDLSETAKKKVRPSKRVGGPIQDMKKGGKAKKKKKKGPTPTNPKLYASVKAAAKRKFKVYPSAYANAWLVREYKKRGGGYK